MNTPQRSNLPLFVLLGLVALSTLMLAASLAGLHVGSGSPAYSAPVLFNQANADAQAGKTGAAILNYERARLLAPADPDIAANLNWVREHAGLPTAPATWLNRATSWASPNTMALLGWMGLVLLGAGILSAQSLPRFRTGSRLAACAGIILLALALLNATATWQKCREAVIVAQETPALISPITKAAPAFKLRSGEMVAITGHYNDFTLVQNSTGHTGWVAQTDLTPLIPQ